MPTKRKPKTDGFMTLGTRGQVTNFDPHMMLVHRLDSQYTQYALSLVTKCSYSAICAYEVGKTKPRPATVKIIAAALGVTPLDLVKGLPND